MPTVTSTISRWSGRLATQITLLMAALVALFPIVLVVINSFKTRRAIFTSPYLPPGPETFSLVG